MFTIAGCTDSNRTVELVNVAATTTTVAANNITTTDVTPETTVTNPYTKFNLPPVRLSCESAVLSTGPFFTIQNNDGINNVLTVSEQLSGVSKDSPKYVIDALKNGRTVTLEASSEIDAPPIVLTFTGEGNTSSFAIYNSIDGQVVADNLGTRSDIYPAQSTLDYQVVSGVGIDASFTKGDSNSTIANASVNGSSVDKISDVPVSELPQTLTQMGNRTGLKNPINAPGQGAIISTIETSSNQNILCAVRVGDIAPAPGLTL